MRERELAKRQSPNMLVKMMVCVERSSCLEGILIHLGRLEANMSASGPAWAVADSSPIDLSTKANNNRKQTQEAGLRL